MFSRWGFTVNILNKVLAYTELLMVDLKLLILASWRFHTERASQIAAAVHRKIIHSHDSIPSGTCCGKRCVHFVERKSKERIFVLSFLAFNKHQSHESI